jgi:hypothetical protein
MHTHVIRTLEDIEQNEHVRTPGTTIVNSVRRTCRFCSIMSTYIVLSRIIIVLAVSVVEHKHGHVGRPILSHSQERYESYGHKLD